MKKQITSFLDDDKQYSDLLSKRTSLGYYHHFIEKYADEYNIVNFGLP
jgi:hypothetical protein